MHQAMPDHCLGQLLNSEQLSQDTLPLQITPLIGREDRKSTRLNSSHANISYAVFCLKKNISDVVRVFGKVLHDSDGDGEVVTRTLSSTIHCLRVFCVSLLHGPDLWSDLYPSKYARHL